MCIDRRKLTAICGLSPKRPISGMREPGAKKILLFWDLSGLRSRIEYTSCAEQPSDAGSSATF